MGNSLVNSTNNYRLFVVFHLKALRALDGIAIVSWIITIFQFHHLLYIQEISSLLIFNNDHEHSMSAL